MKRYLLFLCGLLLAACSSEFEEEAGAVRGGRAVELTGVSGSSTRTSAGAVDGAAIPFLWSADDRIWVNGVQSSEAGTAGAAASFGFSELTGEAPYEVYYNMTGEGARAVVPSRQNQAAAGELQLGANGDFGYATTDAGGHFTLSHATSYIWFDPWSQEVDARLVSVSLATADRTIALCGTRTFDGADSVPRPAGSMPLRCRSARRASRCLRPAAIRGCSPRRWSIRWIAARRRCM